MSFTKEDLEEFKSEAIEILDVAEKKLFEIEQGAEFKAAFDAVFRSFHNLKGASGMMELLALQAHVHELETILMQFKEKSTIPKNYISFFLSGIDGARQILDGNEIKFNYSVSNETSAPTHSPEPAPVSQPLTFETAEDKKNNASTEQRMDAALGEFIAEGAELIEKISASLRVIEGSSYTKENFDDLYRDIHSLKGGAYLFGYKQLGDMAHAMESSMEPIRDGLHQPSKSLIDLIYKAIQFIELEMTGIKNKTASGLNAEVGPAIIRKLNETTSQLSKTSNLEKEEVKMADSNPSPPPIPLVQPAAHHETSSEKDKDSDSGASIRVPVSLLDTLMTLMGEMVLVRNQVIQFSNQSEDLEFLNLSKRLNGVTSEIQDAMMKTRMQPIGNVLSKFHRVARDLSNELKKNITLSISGAETELDKSLLEAIKDPLTHIVRNSCDHGIETPETRRLSGKPDGGTINIRSYHEGGQVVIEVSDDGKGLHPDALIKKALEKGLINQSQVASMTEKEIFNLIFAPGFSTAAVITNVSGRGVGMDVVRTNIEKIGGTVELSSVAGQGTTTKIKIPLTLAIIPALIVKSNHETFAVPQVKLEELVRVEQSSEHKIEYLHGAPIYRLRGNILPLVDLNKVLGFEPQKHDENSIYNIAVLSADQGSFGLIVDEIQDTADIVVKPLNRLLRSLQIYSGATILGDGSISLILDVQGLAKIAHIGTGKESVKADRNEQKVSSDFQEYLLVRLNSDTKHAIVLGYVNRLEEFKNSQIEWSAGSKVIRYGKNILPLISVSELLGYGSSDQTKEVISVVVIQKAGILYGLEVEEILDTLSSDAEVDAALVRTPGFFGNLNTKDELIVAIDPFEIINLAFPDKNEAPSVQYQEKGVASLYQKRSLNILFVEDTPFFRKAVSIILEKEGHDVTIAFNGQDAIEKLNQNQDKFDLIISDIEMPKMNGFELAQAVKGHPKFARIPMLALSSRADKKYSEQGLKSGFDFYLEKLKPAILLDAISKLSGTERKSA